MTTNLARELEVYKSKLPELMPLAGKFVLIFHDDVVGTFESYSDALQAGYAKAKLEPFLVKKILADEQVSYFTRDLGVVACPT